MSTPVGPYVPFATLNETVLTSGQIGIVDGSLVSGGFASELRQVFTNLRTVLKQSNLTLNDVKKTTVFLTSMSDYDEMNRIYMEEFDTHRPARSAIAVAELPLGAVVEIEAIAAA